MGRQICVRTSVIALRERAGGRPIYDDSEKLPIVELIPIDSDNERFLDSIDAGDRAKPWVHVNNSQL